MKITIQRNCTQFVTTFSSFSSLYSTNSLANDSNYYTQTDGLQELHKDYWSYIWTTRESQMDY